MLDGALTDITDEWIEERFEFNFRHLARKDVRPIGAPAKRSALTQVTTYFRENHHEMTRVVETEVDVSLEKDGYILTGAVDLLLADDGALEVLDFKSQRRPRSGSATLDAYYQQLRIYAHILEHRMGRRPDRLLLYWTAEPTREAALTSFEYRPADVDAAVDHFDEVVRKVQGQDFAVTTPPERSVCKECDFRPLCVADGTIDPKVTNR